ncbi:MAG: InlB B-repeat-containing protein, partial [Clostridia bacterium]|nr:InlB B-repeat-containing protein [Clostridia bacterium]
STIQAVVKPFDGFISPTTKNVTILADGSAVVDYFYERKSFNLKLSEGGGIASTEGEGVYEFEESVTINATLLANYHWGQWLNQNDNSFFSDQQNFTFNMPAQELYLLAIAEINSITISFDDQGGSGTVGSMVYDYGSKLDNLVANDLPTKLGYNFAGYYTAKNGEGEQIYTSTGTTEKYCTFTQDTTLYAHWTGKTYNVEYDKNLPEGFAGGEYAPISNQVVFGSAYPALATFTTLPTKTAYNIAFEGWALSANGEVITSETIVNTPNDHTLYAQWTVTAIDYTITFSSGKGYTITASKNGIEFLSGDTVNIVDSVEFTITVQEGYENPELTASGTKRTFKNNILSGVYENIEVTGSVSAIVYTISYTLKGGSVVPANPTSYTIEDTITLNNPKKYGYDFTGWTGSNGNEKQLEVTIPTGTIGNLEYTAHYELTPAVTPVIQSQPISGQTPYGTAYKLSVVVNAIELHTLSYQWLRNGVEIDGATTSTYFTDVAILAGDISEYNVIVTATRDDNGLTKAVVSEIATVEVLFLDFENVQASGAYSGIYTGETRKIITTTATSGALVEYSLDNATWQTETIDFVDTTSGDVTVYWQITKENYNTASGSEIINIMQAPNGWTVTPNIDGWIYGEPSAPIGSATYGEVVFTYSISGEDNFVSQLPLSAGTYTMRAE